MPSRLSLDKLGRNRAYVLVSALIVSTLIETLVHWRAQPDVVFMAIIALSIYAFFELGLFFARLFVKK